MRFLLVGCEVLLRELSDAVAHSPHSVDLAFQGRGLHDMGGIGMRDALQEVVDAADPARHDAVLLGYALCGNGLQGLEARRVALVAPRAHDCIALLLGGRKRYEERYGGELGVYFRSTGWLERGSDLDQLQPGSDAALADLVARYGEDNGRYLFEEFTRYQARYDKLAFIETGLEGDGRFEEEARAEAAEKGWTFHKVPGDLSLFRRLLAGGWDADEFLVVEPGNRIVASYDEGVIRAEPIR